MGMKTLTAVSAVTNTLTAVAEEVGGFDVFSIQSAKNSLMSVAVQIYVNLYVNILLGHS
jgi:hypothetical protein